MPVNQLIGVSITVADLAETATFYRDRLGLDVGPEHAREDPAWNSLLGLEQDATARTVDIAIGQQTLQLVAFDPRGRPYPHERASNDQFFQHLALVSRDIDADWEQLEAGSPGAVTKGPPVQLPPNTGRVTAFKFRDPEGHPLELISFLPGVGDPAWQTASGGIAGYDHTAISVMDIDRSVAFYTGLLGFQLSGRSLNEGPQQDRLDGLTGCEVDVVALQPASAATPHVELLHYRRPRGRSLASEVRAKDVASTRQIHGVNDLHGLGEQLKAAGVMFVSPGVVILKDGGKAAAIRDPDGHMIVLTE